MASLGKFCCFFCPENDYSEKSLDDSCPSCGRNYGFPLAYPPTQIRDFRIIEELGRGFYGAAYVAESGAFNRKRVLKISPAAFYDFFNKAPFAEEAKLHDHLAQNAQHVVGIIDAFEAENVQFSDTDGSQLSCHVTVLDYVEGALLEDYISGKIEPSVEEICQITLDLLRIREEFQANRRNHNDLHTENLIVEKIPLEARRPDCICPTIRVMTIDLGSLSDESKSNENRVSDLSFMATHVDSLLRRLLQNSELLADRDHRIALSLQGVIQTIQSPGQNTRLPNVSDLSAEIRSAYYQSAHPWRPWQQPLRLSRFDDHYNAQTLHSWYVPKLLVDRDNRWLEEITKPGPQIITGMRGCGKTMLLRALDIHARLAKDDGENEENVINRVKNDGYVGLFVSAQRLLDLKVHSLSKPEHRLGRLFINYALQTSRALLHLQDIAPDSLAPLAHTKLAGAVSSFMDSGENLNGAVSCEDLEHRLTNMLVLTSKDPEKYAINAAPAAAFTHLADQFRGCSDVFGSSTVLFLLDDISTRYLEISRIEDLLSSLLFQVPSCAFKFTSEWQTIELGLKSPGREHPIREGRDLMVFDLGEHVLKEVGSPGNRGKQFVSDILKQRAHFTSSHLGRMSPNLVLGDIALEQVAREIASSTETSSKKKMYTGEYLA